MNNILKYMILSDIHLGHDTNKTIDIIRNLDRFFNVYKKEIIKISVLYILGDIFDKLLSNNNKDSVLIHGWLSRLVLFCKEYNIKLRILEGTPGHDFKQIDMLSEIITNLKVDVDYKYFDKLDIENDDGLNVLYIPDEWNHKSKDTFKEVKEKMKEKGLDKVDIAIMHGAFNYQIPYVKSEAFHNEEDYLDIVKYTINIGHVHNHSQFEKIIVPGSFDRLTFIDENITKGGMIVTVNKDTNKFTYKILVNRDSLLFYTIKIDEVSHEEMMNLLDKYNKLNKKVHVRLYSKNKDNKLAWSLRELSAEYSNIILKYTNKIEKDTTNVKDIVKKDVIKRTILRIDNTNIESIVKDELKDMNIDKELKDMVLKELKEIK